jgi:hypothetical protein
MIKTLIAYTTEIDDPECAISKILEQLNLNRRLLKNSVGIMTCYMDFINNGMVEDLCERLPFNVVGINTMYSATANESGQLMLVLVVLTSDDVSFSAGLSGSLMNEQEKTLSDMYRRTASKLQETPRLILTFQPFISTVTGDELVRHLDVASNGVPMFGSMPCDFFATDIRTPLVIYNGMTYGDRAAIVLLCGNIEPKFAVTGIDDDRILKREAIVTDSEGNKLKEVNRVPVLEYLASLGIAGNGQIDGRHLVVPLVIDQNDGAGPTMRTILSQTPEGHIFLSGKAPVNSTLGVGLFDADYVIDTAGWLSEEALGGNYDCMLMTSSIVRNFILGLDNIAEIETIQSRVGETVPFLLSCSGGEISPVLDDNGRLVNRFHNVTAALCAF